MWLFLAGAYTIVFGDNMNEHIRLLAEQARKHHMSNGWAYQHHYEHQTDFEEKFAKILIYECIKIAVFKGDATTGRHIREHFELDYE